MPKKGLLGNIREYVTSHIKAIDIILYLPTN